MNVRRLAGAVLPPVVADMVRRLSRGRPRPAFRGRFRSFSEARAAESAIGDYEAPAIIGATVERTRKLRDGRAAAPEWLQDDWTVQNLAAIRSGLGTNRRAPLRVLDFGGGMGLHYFALRPVLADPGIEAWTVCETTATARAGNAHFAEGPLRFIADLADASVSYDLVLTSGALQYVEDPPAVLARLAALSDVLVLNRVPFLADGDWVALQTTDGSFYAATYPVWFFDEQTWLRRLVDAGLAVKLRWWARNDTITLGGEPVVYQGLLAVRDRPTAPAHQGQTAG